MSLIAGLGNPGREYAGTRHNVGFELIDLLADDLSIPLRAGNGPFIAGEGRFKNITVTLIKPITFMNLSGSAFLKAFNRYQPELNRCLICYDDINLEPGVIRVRPKGSAGGHNGLADIIRTAGSNQIPRLRIGIGNDFPRGQLSRHVLSPFSPEERVLIDEALERAADAVYTFIRAGASEAMNRFN